MYELGIEILKKINDYGYLGYIVGGYVRDKLLGIESNDIDITTNATPMELKNIFYQEEIICSNYGSIILMYKNNRFDITTFRKEEEYLDNRHPNQISYVNDLHEDLLRRDFTINALCIDKNGQIIDLINGKKDLEEKIIKTIGNSDTSFKNDALRMLRAIRFAAFFGFKLSDEVKKAIKENKQLLKNISKERKKRELDKIFGSNKAKEGINLIKELELTDILGLTFLERVKDYSDIVGIWAMINTKEYNFTKSEQDLIKKINQVYEMDNLDAFTLYHYGLYVNVIAGINKGLSKKDILKKYDELPIKNREDINIKAQEISYIYEKKPGSFLSDVFKDLEDKIIHGKVLNNNLDLKKYLMEKKNEK